MPLLAVLPAPEDPEQPFAALCEVLPGVAATKLRVLLTMLKEQRVVTERRGFGFRRRASANPGRATGIIEAYERRAEADRTKLDTMIVYAQTALCRWKLLLESLGEAVDWAECGHCDNCRGTAARAVGAAV